MTLAVGGGRLGLWSGCQFVILHGLLDAPRGGGADALVNRECLVQVGGGLAGVAVLQVAVAESPPGRVLLRGPR